MRHLLYSQKWLSVYILHSLFYMSSSPEDTLCETSSTLIKIVPKFHPKINCIQLRNQDPCMIYVSLNQVTTSFHKDHFFLTQKIKHVIEYMQIGLSNGMVTCSGVMRYVESRKCVLKFLYFLLTNHSIHAAITLSYHSHSKTGNYFNNMFLYFYFT